jgi:isopentenyl-diphosphate delta-isomerase
MSVADAAARRMIEEIGVRGVTLREVGVYLYRAQDPRAGRVDHEYDHVLVGQMPADAPMDPDAAEVADVRCLTPDRRRADLAGDPDSYAPCRNACTSPYRAK